MTPSANDVEGLYRRYAPMVYRRARRFYAADEAEEVVHEVFLRAIERLDSFHGDASPATWLFRLTTNHCLNRLRDEARRAELLLARCDEVPGVNHHLSSQDAALSLQRIWGRLDADHALVGVYFHLDGMTHDDIALAVGCSAATVRNRLKRIGEIARDEAQGGAT